jgi:hypothetical protein
VNDYSPREHDHLVEPLIGGLHAAPKARATGLWIFVAVCAGVIAIRAWFLAAG